MMNCISNLHDAVRGGIPSNLICLSPITCPFTWGAHVVSINCGFLPRYSPSSPGVILLFHHGYIPYPSDEPGSRAKFIDTIHFYRSWTAPSLRAISFSGIVPVPIPGASIQELSLNLQVEFNGVFPDFFVMFRDLLTFLHETPSLQTLKICSSSGETSDSDQIRDFPTVTLEIYKIYLS